MCRALSVNIDISCDKDQSICPYGKPAPKKTECRRDSMSRNSLVSLRNFVFCNIQASNIIVIDYAASEVRLLAGQIMVDGEKTYLFQIGCETEISGPLN